MKNNINLLWGTVAGCAMFVMILDTNTAIISAQAGLQICIKTVIPSLFPFFILSGILNSCLLGQKFGIFRPLGRLCKIPHGSESLLIIGFLAGYPVGARLIAQAYEHGNISKTAAHRMLGFCNNAGPAFLFGMLSPMFVSPLLPWIIWGIHITSALIVGSLLPVNEDSVCNIESNSAITLTKALQNAIKNMAFVCGWVVIFRVIIGFCARWFLWLLPKELQVLLTGFLELSNGIVALNALSSEGVRFVLSSAMLAFGGLCVSLQTASVTGNLGCGYYFPGKTAQCLLCTTISMLLQPVIFKNEQIISVPFLAVVFCGTLLMLMFLTRRRKKVVAFV